ncbi:MAG: hypothetical protein HY904_17380 [Deltaproteobacteria bacterium]|nr:hypothetical protein [Deltaproteobacteria bacterium]
MGHLSSPRPPRFWLLPLLAAPVLVHAWEPPVHPVQAQRALQGDPRLKSDALVAPADADLAAFRAWLDVRFRAHPDPKLRDAYVRRAGEAGLTPALLKALLGVQAGRRVAGVDDARDAAGTAPEIVALGAGQPDLDQRHQDVLATDATGKPLVLPDGRPVPGDPLQANLGAATGRVSQRWAHDGFADVPVSADPELLKADGRRHAVALGWPAGPVKGFVRENVQAHYDLAVLAALWGGRALSLQFFGQALHFLCDAGDPVNGVQVGARDLFQAARLYTWERSLGTAGGFLGELRPLDESMLALAWTHRQLADALTARRVADSLAGKELPESARALVPALTVDDGEFRKDIEMAVAQALGRMGKKPYVPAAGVVASRLVDVASRDGAEVLRHALGASAPRLHVPTASYDPAAEDPDAALGDVGQPDVKAHLDSLYWLQARAFSRVGTAVRLVHSRYQGDVAAAEDAVREERAAAFAEAWLAARVAALEAREARVAAFVKDPPPAPAAVHSLAWLLIPPLLLLALVAAVVALLRRRVTAEEPAAAP